MKLTQVLLILPFLIVNLAHAEPPIPKGDRLLSIAITPPKMDYARKFWDVYEDALDLATSTGMDLPGELDFVWGEVEQRSLFGKLSYTNHDAIKLIEIVKRKSLPLVITVSPFETLTNRIPNDLQKLAYDDPRVIERF